MSDRIDRIADECVEEVRPKRCVNCGCLLPWDLEECECRVTHTMALRDGLKVAALVAGLFLLGGLVSEFFS